MRIAFEVSDGLFRLWMLTQAAVTQAAVTQAAVTQAATDGSAVTDFTR